MSTSRVDQEVGPPTNFQGCVEEGGSADSTKVIMADNRMVQARRDPPDPLTSPARPSLVIIRVKSSLNTVAGSSPYRR